MGYNLAIMGHSLILLSCTLDHFSDQKGPKESNLKSFVPRLGHHHRLILSIAKLIISFIKLVFE